MGSVDGGSGRSKAKFRLALGAAAAGVAAVTAGVIAAFTGSALWPFGHHQQVRAEAQARHYLNATACLLTDPRGITPGAPGAPAWQAMQSASLATHVMVSYLPDTATTASVMLGTLTERKCGVIITTGASAAEVVKAAKADRHQRFVLVAPSSAVGPAGLPNLLVVTPATAPARIDQAIRALAAQARPPGT